MTQLTQLPAGTPGPPRYSKPPARIFAIFLHNLHHQPSLEFAQLSPVDTFEKRRKQLFHKRVQQCTTIYNNAQQCTTMYNNVQQCATTYNNAQKFTTMHNNVQQRTTTYNSVQHHTFRQTASHSPHNRPVKPEIRNDFVFQIQSESELIRFIRLTMVSHSSPW